jgi:hypothetical protein
VLYRSKFAIFDKPRANEVIDFLQSGVSASAAVAGIRYLWLLGENTDLITRLYQRYITEADLSSRAGGHLVREGVAVLKVMGKDHVIRDIFQSNPRALEYCREVIVLHDGQFDSDAFCFSEKLLASYRRLEIGKGEIFHKLKDEKINIAIVGNSPCGIGSGKGVEIDGHDLVFRFNKFSLANKYQIDYGTKVTGVVVTKSILNELISSHDKNLDLIITGEDPLVFPPEPGYEHDSIAMFTNACVVPVRIYQELANILGAAPSSGLQFLQLIYELRHGFENVKLYGFAMNDQVGADPTSSGYGKNTKPSFRHNWIGEAKYLSCMIRGEPAGNSDISKLRFENSLRELDTFKPTRIKILSEDSEYHSGSSAAMQYLSIQVKDQGVLVEDDSFDLLVVNGEGSMRHGSKAYHQKMTALKQAIDTGRRAMLVNTAWQENAHEYDETLQRLDLICAREVTSQKHLVKHGVTPRVCLDLSYWAPLKGGKAYDFNGQPVVTGFYSEKQGTFVNWNEDWEPQLKHIDIDIFTWPDLIESLKTASVLITGRHDAVYAACRAEIPFIAFGGDTHGIEGLIASAGLPIPVCKDRGQINEMLEWVQENRHLYDELYAWMRRQPKFTIPLEML